MIVHTHHPGLVTISRNIPGTSCTPLYEGDRVFLPAKDGRLRWCHVLECGTLKTCGFFSPNTHRKNKIYGVLIKKSSDVFFNGSEAKIMEDNEVLSISSFSHTSS